MKHLRRLIGSFLVVLFVALLLGVVFVTVGWAGLNAASDPPLNATDTLGVRRAAPTSPGDASTLNPNRPGETVKLVFIHHSCGDNWFDDGNGDLGAVLGENNYYVSDTYYNWGPDNIGSYTDIGHWWLWFRGEDSITYTNAVYTTTNQHATYTRPMTDPGDENEIIMFKSCYPNSNLKGDPDEPPTSGDNPLRGIGCWSDHHTVGNAKGIYNDILEYFRTRQDKLFVVITAPPVMADTYVDNARAFNDWLVHEWLADYPHHNVVVFDFYNVLTTNGGDADTNDYGWSTGNHHRVVTTTTPITIEHITDRDDDASPNVLEYPTGGGTNNHPSAAGNQKATGEFVPLLNVYYNCWKHGDCWDDTTDWISVTAVTDVSSVYPGETATYTLSLTASEGFASPVTFTLQGAPSGVVTSFDPSYVIPPGTSQLHITTTASTAAGFHAMTTTAASGAFTDKADLTLIVASAAPSFTLSISPTARIAKPSQIVSYVVSVAGLNGHSQPVSLTVVGLPTGVGAAWSINPVIPGNSSALTLSIPSQLPFGDHQLQVVGVANTQVVVEDIELTIAYPYSMYLPIALSGICFSLISRGGILQ